MQTEETTLLQTWLEAKRLADKASSDVRLANIELGLAQSELRAAIRAERRAQLAEQDAYHAFRVQYELRGVTDAV